MEFILNSSLPDSTRSTAHVGIICGICTGCIGVDSVSNNSGRFTTKEVRLGLGMG